MGGLKMLTQFIKNFKKTEFWTNRNLQIRVIIVAAIITIISKISPELHEDILTIVIYSIVLFGPIAILGIYYGIGQD